MTLGDIYKSKTSKRIIQIDSFAKHMGKWGNNFVIVYTHIFNNGGMYGSSPSDNGYGTKEEIENEYELLLTVDQLKDYKDWKDVFSLIK